MQYPNAPEHMFIYSNKTIKNFGYDQETDVEYKFNSLGYRSNIEYQINKRPIVVLGNTLSFGLGVAVEDTFAYKIAKETSIPVYNLSWGCYGHTNNEQAKLLKLVLSIDSPSLIIFQINNLNRYRERNSTVNFNNNTSLIFSEHKKFYNEISILLKEKKHIFLYWDDEHHDMKLPDCLIKNKYFIDTSLNFKRIFGKKSHHLIYLKIIEHINKNKLL